MLNYESARTQTHAAMHRAGVRAHFCIQPHKRPHACTGTCIPAETRMVYEPMLGARLLLFNNFTYHNLFVIFKF